MSTKTSVKATTNHHRFPYDPRMYVSNNRRYELRVRAVELLNRHVKWFRSMRYLTFTDFGDILRTINGRSVHGVTTDEKACSWCYIVGQLGDWRGNVRVTTSDLVSENVDQWNTGVSWGHVVVSFLDPRHGTVHGKDSYTDGTMEQAIGEIDAYERQLGGIHVGIRNEGDYRASINTVRTMFAFRSGGFTAFTQMWNLLFLDR